MDRNPQYNGTGIALGQALEQISGLDLPNLYQQYLFGPLGSDAIESIRNRSPQDAGHVVEDINMECYFDTLL